MSFQVKEGDKVGAYQVHHGRHLGTDLLLNENRSAPGGDRSEAWDRETMFSQLAKRSSQNVDSGVRNNKYFRSTRIDIAINLFEIVFKIYVYFVGESKR